MISSQGHERRDQDAPRTVTRLFGMSPERGRWGYVLAGLLINLCLGSVYAFSVFRTPLMEHWNIGATATGFPFMVFLAMFAVGMAVAGPFIARWGPRRVSVLGSVMVALGWLLSAASPSIAVLTVFYGVLGGIGVGVLYGCPIATTAQWFPDRRGLAVGLTVLGFGISPLVSAPLISGLIGRWGVLPTFAILGGLFLVLLVALASLLRFPDGAWVPEGWTPTEVQSGRSTLELDRRQMLRTGAFYALWSSFGIGSVAGLMAIGFSWDFGVEVAQVEAGLATTALAVFAVFNGIGRPAFGWLTDRTSPRVAAVASFAMILVASASLYLWGEGSVVLYLIAFSVLWMNLGGWVAIAPASTAALFGARHYARNFSVVFSSYGVGAIVGTVLSGAIKDATGNFLPVFLPVLGLAGAGIVISLVGLRPEAAKSPSQA